MKVVVSDRDRRVTVGPHVVNLKAGENKVPDGLAHELVEIPGIKAKTKAKSPEPTPQGS